VRHGKRHLPYAVSTVLGLAVPALAAILLTSSTPGLAAVPLAPVEAPERLHGPVHVTHAPKAAPVAQKRVVTVVPVQRKAATQPTARRVTTRRTTTTAATAPRTTTSSTTTTTVSQTKQPWGVDDYPYRNQTDYYAMDRWGFTERQCVSFAAWRLAQHGDTINNKDNWGSAYTWDDTARRLGFRVSRTAHVGDVAQWNAHESGAFYSKGSATANGTFSAGGYGHVGWVKQVYSDGSALVEQYNMGNSRSYSVMRVKAPRYLGIG
jgi:surface antigen